MTSRRDREPRTVDELLDGSRRRTFPVVIGDTIVRGRRVKVALEVDIEDVPVAVHIAHLRWLLMPLPDRIELS